VDGRHLRLARAPASSETAADPEGRIDVVLADDHGSVRHALRLLLEGESDVEVLADVADLASMGRSVDVHRPDVLVLDLGMSEGANSETLLGLYGRAPRMRIVIATMEEHPVFARSALAAGAAGFVLKDLADEELPTAIRLAARGEHYVSPRLVLPLAEMHRAGSGDRLSMRELEVLRLIALGHTNAEVAGRLRLSPRTVETHRARIQRKLGTTTRAELVAYALGRGLLRP
jgi:two-component system response regulator NreC